VYLSARDAHPGRQDLYLARQDEEKEVQEQHIDRKHYFNEQAQTSKCYYKATDIEQFINQQQIKK